jgi:hypothetical protein
MKLLKSSWKVCLVAVGSLAFGAWLFHVRTVGANPQAGRTVRITSVFMGTAGSAAHDTVVDGPIVGFSCVSNVSGPSGYKSDRVCFIATHPGD